MPEQLLTMAGPIGYFGKVPSKGDFVSSNLPGSFIRPWDNWLRLTLSDCRERLGDQSRAVFLLSPVWRFVLGPGCCGPQAWAGVVASSVDRIGRIYPLTLAVALDGDDSLTGLMAEWANGFERLIDLALTMVGDETVVDRSIVALQQILDEQPPAAQAAPPALVQSDDAELAPGDSLSVASVPKGPQFENACAAAVMRAGPQLSLMWQIDWGLPPLAVIGCGLPDTARSATIWEMSATASLSG